MVVSDKTAGVWEGPALYSLFINFHGANTLTVLNFKLPTIYQQAHKISDNWTGGSHEPTGEVLLQETSATVFKVCRWVPLYGTCF